MRQNTVGNTFNDLTFIKVQGRQLMTTEKRYSSQLVCLSPFIQTDSYSKHLIPMGFRLLSTLTLLNK